MRVKIAEVLRVSKEIFLKNIISSMEKIHKITLWSDIFSKMHFIVAEP
jgi:hypothetical protein